MNRLQLNHIPSCQTTRGLLTRLPALFVLLGSSTFLQAQYEPVSPIATTSAEECKTFSLAMSAFLRTMSKAHEQCLAQKIKEGAKASMESDSRICSQPACQQYHMDPKRAGDDNQKVSACYQEANQYVARKAEEKKLEEDQQKKRDAEQSLADKQRRDRAADQQKQQQSQADKQAQQKQQALADKERAATAAERATHLKAQAENAKRDRKDQERIAAARNAEELQRLEAQQNASREKALADQKERHRSRPADDSVAQQADRSDANGKQLLATMNADPFGTNRNGKTDPGPDVGSIADGPNPFAGAVEKQEAQKTNVPTVATEMVSNAWDEDITKVEVTLTRPDENNHSWLHVTDNSPTGWSDLSHAHTMFAESTKKAKSEKRGRFNAGEKDVLALAIEAKLTTVKGQVLFNEDGTRTEGAETREVGSEFAGRFQLTQEEYENIMQQAKLLIPPKGNRHDVQRGGDSVQETHWEFHGNASDSSRRQRGRDAELGAQDKG